jgi:hypothetical protein
MIAHPAPGPGAGIALVMAQVAPGAGTGTALLLLMTLLFVVAALSAFGYWRQRRGNDSDDGGSGPGGSGPQQHRPPDNGPAGDEFPWWPEFERRFGDYLKSRGQGRSGPSRPPDAFSPITLEHGCESSSSRRVPGVVASGGDPPPAPWLRHGPEDGFQLSRDALRPHPIFA